MTEGRMGTSQTKREGTERHVLIGAMFVVSSLLVAAAAVELNRGPLGVSPVPGPPEIIELERIGDDDSDSEIRVRWAGLPPVFQPADDSDRFVIEVDEPGQIVDVTLAELEEGIGGQIIAVGNDVAGIHVFPSLELTDDGSWLPVYRVVAPWNLNGRVDVPVVVEDEAGESTRFLTLSYEPPARDLDGFVIEVQPEQMSELGELAAESGPLTFLLPPGEYREVSVRPRSGQTFIGAAGSQPTVLNGSRLVEKWTETDDGLWVSTPQAHQEWAFLDGNDRVRRNPSDDEWGTCERDAGDVCKLPELLFMNFLPLERVFERDEVEEGTWYFDYATDEIVVADDPRRAVVEFSAESQAFTSLADDVRIENLVVMKYASPMRQGAIQPRLGRIEEEPGENWVISGVEVAWNHGYGIKADIGMIIEHSWIHDNFQMGIGAGSSQDVVIRRSEISGNCAGSSNIGAKCDGHSGGGVKLDFSDRATLRENFVHGNFPHGLHVDQFSKDALFVGNVAVDNTNAGLHFEISSGALLERNYAAGNGEAGILVISSSGVSVTGNHVTSNEDAILVRQDERCRSGRPECVRGLRVDTNYVDLGIGSSGLTWSSRRAPNPYTNSADNTFARNVYVVAQGNCRAEPFRWDRSTLDWSDWFDEGLDNDGHIIWPECVVAGPSGPGVGATGASQTDSSG